MHRWSYYNCIVAPWIKSNHIDLKASWFQAHTILNKHWSRSCVAHASEDLPKTFYIWIFRSTTYALLLAIQPLHTRPHTFSYPLPFDVGVEYPRRNQGECGPSGSLSWYARLVILQSQFLTIWWAPVCHLPVHSVCPELWLPPRSVFYNDILASHGTLILTQQLACTHMPMLFADALLSDACSFIFHHSHDGMHGTTVDSLGLALQVSAKYVMLTSLTSEISSQSVFQSSCLPFHFSVVYCVFPIDHSFAI